MIQTKLSEWYLEILSSVANPYCICRLLFLRLNLSFETKFRGMRISRSLILRPYQDIQVGERTSLACVFEGATEIWLPLVSSVPGLQRALSMQNSVSFQLCEQIGASEVIKCSKFLHRNNSKGNQFLLEQRRFQIKR